PGDRAAAYRPHPVRARGGTRGRDTAATTTAVVAAAATGQLGTADDYRNHRPAERTTGRVPSRLAGRFIGRPEAVVTRQTQHRSRGERFTPAAGIGCDQQWSSPGLGTRAAATSAATVGTTTAGTATTAAADAATAAT